MPLRRERCGGEHRGGSARKSEMACESNGCLISSVLILERLMEVPPHVREVSRLRGIRSVNQTLASRAIPRHCDAAASLKRRYLVRPDCATQIGFRGIAMPRPH